MRIWIALLVSVFSKAHAQTETETAFLETALGSWSSQEQSVDETYSWVNSELARIWTDDEDGIWIYQENTIYAPDPETLPETEPEPYFQVVIHLRDLGDGLLHTTTHRIVDRASARQYSLGNLAEFNSDWLGEVACMGKMQQVADGFWNGAATCPNNFRGGAKVESRSVYAPGAYVNWDRGFNAAGEHIWGPAQGGYIFKRVEEEE